MSKASELRQDPITGKWVVIATGRAKRPLDQARLQVAKPAPPAYLENCPFCNLAQFPQRAPTLVSPRGKGWRVMAFPNKFPAFVPADRVTARKMGLYTVMDGVGFHEVIVVRPHNGFLARLEKFDLVRCVEAWRARYRALMTKPSVAYIQLIENHGRESGGSQEHSHLQLFAIPVLPSDEVLDLLKGAEAYYDENGSCAYCDILAFEREQKTRIVWENDRFTVLSPFTSRVPHEQWVLPRTHAAGFEALADEDLPALAEALQEALARLDRGFKDPPYNLYIYSAPCDTEGFICEKDEFQHFHWHVQILPRLNIWGGFELATGLEIHSVLPEECAAFLRSA
ncbi:MAG: UDPglucose--hexose-1-phosphate uridylyltransferase [Parcubacteria group bacterium Gr01-1014_38]|nr:MAG: UDPglucose--hexose-1-phosphate uridylyltransferase [Parcubacteria group bacterium Gr01-1014_38]